VHDFIRLDLLCTRGQSLRQRLLMIGLMYWLRGLTKAKSIEFRS